MRHTATSVLFSLVTLITCLACVGVCAIGMAHPPSRYQGKMPPQPIVRPPQHITVSIGEPTGGVNTTDNAANAIRNATAVPLPAAPPLPKPAAPAPPLVNLPAAPSVASESALASLAPLPVAPVAPPTPAPSAASANNAAAGAEGHARASSATPVPTRLIFNQAEGRQPAPDYPAKARLENQTGTVRVRFTVDTRGHVTDALTIVPCQWRLLNESAVNAVRYQWRFAPGDIRIYEVDIRFELQE